MSRWVRGLMLASATGVALALTAVLIGASSQRGVAASPPNVSAIHSSTPTAQALLEPALAKVLETAAPGERFNVIVEMREQVAPSTLVADRAHNPDARRVLVSTLQATAKQTQADVRAYLSARTLAGDVTRVTPFWIFNGLAVHGARPEIVRELAGRPDVGLIRLDRWRRWIEEEPEVGNWEPTADSPSVAWGVERIRADKVWHSLGVSGTGVVVASIDTGVDWRHPALQANYRGYSPKGFHQHEGNWYDATEVGALYPVDGNGHGSHTMGTMVAAGGVGVAIGIAPGARWIAVRAFDSRGFAFDSWLHAGFEWLLAPDGDPDLAPRVVNNSWGSDTSSLTTFVADIDALRAAGIFPLFSAGNAGPKVGTVGSPASLPRAFAVGASDQDEEVADFSSRGPSPWGDVRPHLVAPGVNVLSTLPGGTYREMHGTSMAVPHVAGTVALMLSAAPHLNITQTGLILTGTAVPLTIHIPNNNSGYGRIDAYAAVALAANAGLVSGTVRGDGDPLPGATVHATPAISGLEGTASADQEGRYQLFLGAGYYDLAASAFGYTPAYAHAVPVITGSVTIRDFDLSPLPTGLVQGTITAQGGESVAATVSALNTPVEVLASGGNYQMDLPGGRYTLEARSLGYRVVTASVTVTAGQNTLHDFVLPESMRLLLVDSGAWYYQNQSPYYRQALDDSSFVYDEHHVKHLPQDTPTLTELLAYDLVIWSAPDDSPGLVNAGQVITDYLHSGGNLLLSGQDVAFWDGGGTLDLHRYYSGFLHSIYRADDAPSRQVVCLDDSAFGGFTLTIEGGDGADNQSWPDEIGVKNPDHASLACNYDGGQGAVIQAGFCNAHRALNMSFGFESIDNASDRAGFMSRALDWFDSPRQMVGIEMLRQSNAIQVSSPGEVVTHTFRLRDLGEAGAGDVVQIEVNGDLWPTTVLTPIVDLEPCATAPVVLRVEIPTDVSWNAFDAVTVTARSTAAPALSQTLVITSKAPAPVLLVDDDRWFDQEAAYEAALKAHALPYDRWEVTGIHGDGSPTAEELARYSIVLWFTGYDWFDPLHPNELGRLTGYLEGGGRIFVSSQDALYYIADSDFAHDYLGVISYTEALSQSTAQGVPGHVLGNELGPVALDYPFRNWSDSVLPAPGTQVAFRGQHGQPAAVTREGICDSSPSTCRWRTALFPFPIEALPLDVRTVLVSRLVGWLNWLGGSELKTDRPVARVGDTIAYTLTLRNDGPGAVLSATVSNTLPSDTTLLDGPAGGAAYDPGARRLTWTGDLEPGNGVTFTYRLQLESATALDTVYNVADLNLGEQKLHFRRQATIRIAAPDLAASSLTMSPLQKDAVQPPGNGTQATATVGSSREYWVTLVLRNDGLEDAANARVTSPLLWPSRLITGTLSSGGVGTATERLQQNRVLWEGPLAVGAPVTLTFRALAPPVLREGLWLYNAAHLEDGLGGAWERGGWLYVTPHRYYYPVVFKDE